MPEKLVRRTVRRWEQLSSAVEHARAYRAQRADALATLELVRRNAGVRLSTPQRTSCDEYAADVLGSRWHAPWLYVYTALRGEFLEGWIPGSYMGRWVAPAMSGGLGAMAGTKSLTRRLLPDASLPDMGYLIDGRVYDRDLTLVDSREFIHGLAREHDSVMVKSDGAYRGFGVRRVATLELLTRDPRTLGNAVIQEVVRQHPALEKVVPGVVATYRIVTVKEPDGAVGTRSGSVKYGRAGDDAVRGSSKFTQCVVADDGTVHAIGHTEDWTPSRVHPDTGVALAGGRLPRYREATELCRRLHRQFPHFGLIGWDVTVDDTEQVRVLEWNAGHIGVSYAEAVIGPCFTGLGWEDLHRGRVSG